MFINTYNYYYILRWFGFFNVASNFVKRKCVYKFNKKLIIFPYYVPMCTNYYVPMCTNNDSGVTNCVDGLTTGLAEN